jgi:hypothetical protein
MAENGGLNVQDTVDVSPTRPGGSARLAAQAAGLPKGTAPWTLETFAYDAQR